MKKIIIIVIGFAISLNGILALGIEREKFSVEGESDRLKAFYHEIFECDIAIIDAKTKASQICYGAGYDNGWTHAQLSECSSRLLGGKTVEMTFYCK